MKKQKTKTKNILLSGIFISSLFFIILGVVYAESACSNKLTGLNRYSSCQVLTGDTLTVNAEGCTNTCFKISNTSGKSVFIPTNTCAEWDAFLAHMPNGISTSSCTVAPTISVSDTTKTLKSADFIITHSTNSDGAKTFSSSDTSVATITNAGLVTIVGAGTTTITFNTVATETYSAGTDTATLTITNPTEVLTFTTVGDTTWTVPAGVYSVDVYVLGGGGGGGNNGSGGGGETANVFGYSVSPGEVIDITVGAGGANGLSSYGYYGGPGGTSSFGTVSALGGCGGRTDCSPRVYAAGGSGGTHGVTSPNLGGSDGGNGQCYPTNCAGQGESTVPFFDDVNYDPLGGGGGGTGQRTGNNNNVLGGFYGGGLGCSVDCCNGSPGIDGTGGGGGSADGYGKIGGRGGSGRVMVRY